MVIGMSDIYTSDSKKTDVKRKYFSLPDLILAVVVVIAAVFGFLGMIRSGEESDLVAVVKVGGVVYKEISLSEVDKEYNLTVKGYDAGEIVLCITRESVEFVQSPCEDKLCVNTGRLTKSGDSAVCLPQRVSVKLVSADSTQSAKQPDAVVG